MSRQVYKHRGIYPGSSPIQLPGRPVHFDIQENIPSVWYIQDFSEPVAPRYDVVVLGTGYEIPDGFEHVHTRLSTDTVMVWHLFARPIPGA